MKTIVLACDKFRAYLDNLGQMRKEIEQEQLKTKGN